MQSDNASVGACMWLLSRTAARRRPFCCGKATARPARPRTEPSPTCRAGPPSALSNCAPCCGDKLLPAAAAVEIVRALPHGHVLAALGTARRIALDAVLPRRAPQRRRDLALALIVARLLEPAAKLATARMLDPATASQSLGEVLGLGRVTARGGYAALDWLGGERPFIEATLARRHLKNGALLL